MLAEDIPVHVGCFTAGRQLDFISNLNVLSLCLFYLALLFICGSQ